MVTFDAPDPLFTSMALIIVVAILVSVLVIMLSAPLINATFINLNQSSPTFNKTIALFQPNIFNTCISEVGIQDGETMGNLLQVMIPYPLTLPSNYTPLPSNQIDLYVSYYNKIQNGTLKVCGE